MNVNLASLKSDIRVKLGVTAVVSASAGATAAYLLTKKKYRKILDVRIAQEAEALRTIMLNAAGLDLPETEEVEEVEAEVLEAEPEPSNLVDYHAVQRVVYNQDEKEEATVAEPELVPNAWYSSVTGKQFIYDEEEKTRSEDVPYVISELEFQCKDFDFEQTCLTFYEKCGTLADDRDQVVDDEDDLVGRHNLERFGDGSDHNDIVFVRNHRKGMEFEIERVHNSFTAVVYGVEDDE